MSTHTLSSMASIAVVMTGWRAAVIENCASWSVWAVMTLRDQRACVHPEDQRPARCRARTLPIVSRTNRCAPPPTRPTLAQPGMADLSTGRLGWCAA
jgi:hypothetical protein